jgi:hypothetical protein
MCQQCCGFFLIVLGSWLLKYHWLLSESHISISRVLRFGCAPAFFKHHEGITLFPYFHVSHAAEAMPRIFPLPTVPLLRLR